MWGCGGRGRRGSHCWNRREMSNKKIIKILKRMQPGIGFPALHKPTIHEPVTLPPHTLMGQLYPYGVSTAALDSFAALWPMPAQPRKR